MHATPSLGMFDHLFNLYHDFKHANYEMIEMYLSGIDWECEFSFVFNVEDYWSRVPVTCRPILRLTDGSLNRSEEIQ